MRYFDYNATAPLSTVAREAWLKAQEQFWFNASSPYRAAASVRNALEEQRAKLGCLLGCQPERIVFTSGATEANNAVLAYFHKKGSSLAISAVEHSSIYEPATRLYDATLLPVTLEGVLDLEALRQNQDSFVSVMAANNETGVIQPWEAVLEDCMIRGRVFHCDATQWVGKLSFEGLVKIPWVSISAHKFGGPKGCGFLLIPEDAHDFHISLGGGHEKGHRAGTENYAAIASMVAALEDALTHKGSPEGRDALVEYLKSKLPDVVIHAESANRLWNTLNVALPQYVQYRWVNRLDKAGFLVSAGSACSTGKDGPSHVLKAMGVSNHLINHSIRISCGYECVVEDWLDLGKTIVKIWEALQKESAGSNVIKI